MYCKISEYRQSLKRINYFIRIIVIFTLNIRLNISKEIHQNRWTPEFLYFIFNMPFRVARPSEFPCIILRISVNVLFFYQRACWFDLLLVSHIYMRKVFCVSDFEFLLMILAFLFVVYKCWFNSLTVSFTDHSNFAVIYYNFKELGQKPKIRELKKKGWW